LLSFIDWCKLVMLQLLLFLKKATILFAF